MPVYLFGAPQHVNAKNAQTGQMERRVQLLNPGMVWRWAINARTPAAAKWLSQRFGIGNEEQQRHGIRYIMYPVKEQKNPELICCEKFIGTQPQAIPPGAQQQGAPTAQSGQQRMDGARGGTDGFEVLGDPALSAGFDEMYGDPNDGTFTDLVQGMGGGSMEMPRG